MRIFLTAVASMFVLVSIQPAVAAYGGPATTNKISPAAAYTFSRDKSLPKWADPLLDIPPARRKSPVVIRLAETQAWLGDQHAVLLNRAIEVNAQSGRPALGTG